MAQNLKINILAKDKTKQAFNGIRGRLQKLKDSVISVKGAIVGIGAGLVVKSFVNVGKNVEDLQVRLKQLFGSTQEGAKAFDVMAKFASKVPFSLEQIQNASGNLAVVAGDANRLSKILEITGNVASVTGIDFQTTAEQIQRAFAGGIASADIFREKGVRDMLGFKAGATVSAEDTIKAFEKVFGKGGKFGGATDELANTFTGVLSMLGDSLFNFKKRVADADFFDAIKKEFKDLDDFIKENQDTFNDIADAIGFVLTGAVKVLSGGIKGLAKATALLTDAYESLVSLVNKILPKALEFNIVTKAQRQLQREIAELEKERFERMGRILEEQNKINISLSKQKEVLVDVDKVRKAIQKAKDKEDKLELFILSEKNKKRLEFNELINKGVEKHKEQNDILRSVGEKLREHNASFSITDTIFESITGATSSFSRTLAEALVLGKSINKSFKELAQGLLVDIVAKMIERIALLTIEKFIIDKIFKQDTDKLKMEKNITKEKQKQVMLQALLMAMGGGSGGSGFKLFASGGAVRKGQPTIVGEQGAEMFIPNSSGQITQSARGTGNGAVNVNFTINTIDSRGFDQALIENRGTISSIINSALAEKGRGELI
tara:strand:- start:197 stop:2014 length:1818 start_codon:yes stop_codon:yes gene_type:complete